MVRAVPGVPAPAGRAARRPAARAGGRPVLRPLPARRADGGGRRLPRHPPGRPRPHPAPGRRRAASPWARGTRCPTSSWCRARRSSATSSSASTTAGAARRRHAGRLPARHVRPRRPDAPAAAPASASHDAVVWRGVPSAVDRTGVLVGGTRRHRGAGRVPARPATATAPACPTIPSALVGRIDAGSPSSTAPCWPAAPVLWMNGTDHQVPQPWLRRRGGQANDARQDRLRLADHVARRLPRRRRRTRRRLAPLARASCARAPGPTCSWASRRTGSTCEIAAARAERVLERVAEPLAAALLTAEQLTRHALLAEAWLAMVPQRRPRLGVRVQRTTRSSTTVLHRYAEARQIGRRPRRPGGRAPRRRRRPRRPGRGEPVGPAPGRGSSS